MSNLILMHDIGNTYGGMRVYTRDGKFFWDIEDYDTPALDERGNETLDGSEIPESLYKELLAHYHKDKSARDREEAIQEALHAERSKAQAAEWATWAEEDRTAKALYRKNNPICDYATPALMLEGYYAGDVDRDALLRTFEETGIEHTVCDVTGMITLGYDMLAVAQGVKKLRIAMEDEMHRGKSSIIKNLSEEYGIKYFNCTTEGDK